MPSNDNSEKLPPVHQQARSVLGAISRAVRAMVDAQPLLTPLSTAVARRQVCLSCKSAQRRGKGKLIRCVVCGCYIAAKIRMATESCPRGKW
jgi:hypothetical protein